MATVERRHTRCRLTRRPEARRWNAIFYNPARMAAIGKENYDPGSGEFATGGEGGGSMGRNTSGDDPKVIENVRRGNAAMNKAISEKMDAMDAMHRDEVGSISFVWGTPGDPSRGFRGGSGLSHIVAKRKAEGSDGEAVARKMVDVIARGRVSTPHGPAGGERVLIRHDGHTAVLSLHKNGTRQTWLLTGWVNR